ncbi:MAG: type II toxin-antitoxin system HicB family antitoxin [Phascolarctobacterium sp.]|nr:type II toxin-antitoxin system HicB family antitoxin [Phascolarctobacterium sp.]
MLMKAVYPAVFTPCSEGGYFVKVPDLQVMTQGENLAEAIEMSRDAIKLAILELELHNEKIPTACSVEICTENEDFISYIDIDMRGYREKYGGKSVKKNCTIPQWLDDMAKAHNINFSNVLQNALMKELGIEPKA